MSELTMRFQMSEFTQLDIRQMLSASPDPQTSRSATDFALVAALTRVFNATLEIAADVPRSLPALSMALGKKSLAVASAAGQVNGSKTLRTGAFVGQQVLESIGLLKLAKDTPTKALFNITLFMANKLVMTAGYAEFDKCKVAIASLAVTAGQGGVACFATMGVGCAVGAVFIIADAFDLYAQCRK